MDEKKILADRFEANRAHLQAFVYCMFGSRAEAEEAVQEAWLRLVRTDAGDVGNLGGWLTTVVARICLDTLRSRKIRREEPIGETGPTCPTMPSEAARTPSGRLPWPTPSVWRC